MSESQPSLRRAVKPGEPSVPRVEHDGNVWRIRTVTAARQVLRARDLTTQAVAHSVLDSAALTQLVPSLAGGEAQSALFLAEGGVLDLHELTSRLARAARAGGATLETSMQVAHIELAAGSDWVVVPLHGLSQMLDAEPGKAR